MRQKLCYADSECNLSYCGDLVKCIRLKKIIHFYLYEKQNRHRPSATTLSYYSLQFSRRCSTFSSFTVIILYVFISRVGINGIQIQSWWLGGIRRNKELLGNSNTDPWGRGGREGDVNPRRRDVGKPD